MDLDSMEDVRLALILIEALHHEAQRLVPDGPGSCGGSRDRSR
ncbi:hypothetical protein [Streptosporangium sandarakinum]